MNSNTDLFIESRLRIDACNDACHTNYIIKTVSTKHSQEVHIILSIGIQRSRVAQNFFLRFLHKLGHHFHRNLARVQDKIWSGIRGTMGQPFIESQQKYYFNFERFQKKDYHKTAKICTLMESNGIGYNL